MPKITAGYSDKDGLEKDIFGLIPKVLIGVVNATMPEVTKML